MRTVYSKILAGAGFAALAFSSAGCDSATSSTSSTTSTSIAIDNLPTEIQGVFCKVADCMGMWFSTPTGCVDTMGGFAEMEQVAWVKAGLVTYDGAKARECLTAMTTSCAFEGAEPEACRLTFVGKLDIGAACAEDELCKSVYCKKSGSGCGVCAEPQAAGKACDGSSSCATGLACIKGVCAAPGTIAAGGECGSDKDCVADHYCKQGQDKDLCTPKAAKDAECSLNAASCKAGLVCSGDFGSGNMQSGKCTTAHKAGETCGNPYKSDCEKGLVCGFAMPTKAGEKITSKCVPLVKVGTACEFTVQCGVDGWCNSGKCAALPKAGEMCAKAGMGDGTKCAANLDCGNDGKCADLPAVGQDCTFQCVKGASCVASKCVADSAVGGACSQEGNGPKCKTGLFCTPAGTCSATPACK